MTRLKGLSLCLIMLLLPACHTNRQPFKVDLEASLSSKQGELSIIELTPSRPLRFALRVGEPLSYHQRDVWFEVHENGIALSPVYADIFFPPGEPDSPRHADVLSNQLEIGLSSLGGRFISIRGEAAGAKKVTKAGRFDVRFCVHYKDRRGRLLAVGKTEHIPIRIGF